jgi:putative ATP-binding cassette transporter
MTRLRRLARDVWILTEGYWASEERWPARLLLAAVICLNLGLVGVNLLQNLATGALFTALQQRNAPGFHRAFAAVVLLILAYLVVAVLRVYLDQTLQLRWRRWLTDRYVTSWLAGRAFYRLGFSGRIDNPDQRISEDVRLFIERTMGLGIGLLSALATLASFATVLWSLSGSITLAAAGVSVTIPGYLFWVALLYAGLGSVIAHLIGRPLISLNNRQQAAEADFRFSLVRLREEAEGVALYGGEAQERSLALARFGTLYRNFRRIIRRSNQYLMFQLLFSQGTSSFALLIASPRYFAGVIQLGTLTRTANAFERVNEALSWFIESYTAFAEWRATVDRLTEFATRIAGETAGPLPGVRIEPAAQEGFDLTDLAVFLPDGRPLIGPATLSLQAGETVLLRGPAGSGKSTLFRVLAGLWPFATGHIRRPAGATTLFVPQRPYLPMGTLREALWFPGGPEPGREDEVLAALAMVGLPGSIDCLDEELGWGQALSPGEQQKLAIARALLVKPDWLFLDEATSALDEAEEATLYRLLARALPGTTIVSIGHRRSLEAHHTRVITIDHAAERPGKLVGHAGDLVGVGRPANR